MSDKKRYLNSEKDRFFVLDWRNESIFLDDSWPSYPVVCQTLWDSAEGAHALIFRLFFQYFQVKSQVSEILHGVFPRVRPWRNPKTPG
jgi:hypothetical protein